MEIQEESLSWTQSRLALLQSWDLCHFVRDSVFHVTESVWIDKKHRVIYALDGWHEKVAIIDYHFSNIWADIICYISFFGTQNAPSNTWYRELLELDIGAEIKKNWLSYTIMRDFIERYCYPNQVKRIYLDAADAWLKSYWKGKMWKFLQEEWFAQSVYSQSQEVCFVLKT